MIKLTNGGEPDRPKQSAGSSQPTAREKFEGTERGRLLFLGFGPFFGAARSKQPKQAMQSPKSNQPFRELRRAKRPPLHGPLLPRRLTLWGSENSRRKKGLTPSKPIRAPCAIAGRDWFRPTALDRPLLESVHAEGEHLDQRCGPGLFCKRHREGGCRGTGE